MKPSTKLALSYLGFCCICLALGGIVLANLKKPHASVQRTEEPDPRHWITEDMRKATSALSKSKLPPFVRTDTDGEKIDIEAEVAKKPVFLIFIMDGCPCSYEAQPFFQRLYATYGDKVEFIAVTDGTLDQAKEWKAHFDMVYAVISEPKKALMHQYHAIHSAYTALLTKEQGIQKLWPGYSRDELDSIAQTLSEVSGSSKKVGFADAPKKPTSGCIF